MNSELKSIEDLQVFAAASLRRLAAAIESGLVTATQFETRVGTTQFSVDGVTLATVPDGSRTCMISTYGDPAHYEVK